MSKKFKGKLCAYCMGAAATTDDHVFAREFFLLEDRHRLPKAPACQECNGRKSRLEHYLTAVLPFGGRHPHAVETLKSGVPPRLAKNRKLQRNLATTMEPAWLREGTGLFQPTSMISFDGAQLEELLKYIARGLAWHHWKLYLGRQDDVSVMFLTDVLTAAFQSMISTWRVAQRVENDLGRGTVVYTGVQVADPKELTVWSLSMYGGVVLADGRGSNAAAAQTSCRWWVITGPPEIAATVARLK